MKLVPIVWYYGWQGWAWIQKPGKVGPPFSSFNAVIPTKKNTKQYYGLYSLVRFVWYLLRNSTGEFCVWVKALSNDLSTGLCNGLKRAIMILIRSPLIRHLFIPSLSKVYSSNQPLKFLNGSVVPYVYHKLRDLRPGSDAELFMSRT